MLSNPFSRLTGDFFKYLKELENSNLELQKQLDSVVGKLEESQLNQIRTENSLKSHKEQTVGQMALLMGEYKQAEVEHQSQLKEMAETIQVLQKELYEKRDILAPAAAAATTTTNIQPPTVVPEVLNFKTKSSKSNDEMGNEVERLKYHLSAAEAQNAYLAALSDKTQQELQHKEVEMDQLWAQIYDLQANLQDAYQSESAFQIQSIAIEELRTKLEQNRLDPEKKYAFDPHQASMIENMLPSTSDRLVRTEEGWYDFAMYFF